MALQRDGGKKGRGEKRIKGKREETEDTITIYFMLEAQKNMITLANQYTNMPTEQLEKLRLSRK